MVLYFCNKSRKNSFYRSVQSALIKLGFFLAFSNITTPKVLAAEEIFLDYGPLQFSLSVESLKNYAETGKITGDLKSYADFLTPEQLETLRVGLTTQADIKPLSIAQFFYSYQGERILERVGQIIKTKAGQPGFYAIRSALILAAAQEDGLTPINFLEAFPTSGIKLDSARGFEIIDELSQVIQTSDRAIAAVQEEAIAEALSETSDVATSLNGNGSYTYQIKSFFLRDQERKRNFPVDLYLPQTNSNAKPLPLIIISHGLGSDRSSMAYFAKYMASYGFAVAVPEHPGSNASQIENLLEGFANDVTPPDEFVNRPLDITFLLDQLETEYAGQIDTQNTGIIGQSFGGYTALAVAGAELNFEALTLACENLDRSFNISLFLQCVALNLPQETTQTNLRDPRIASAIAINPLSSAVFAPEGLSQINVPVMIVSGSDDPVTPALLEQIRPFSWLDTPEKYLVLMEGGTHFSVLNESGGTIPVPEAALGPDPRIAQNYIRQLGLLFFSDRSLPSAEFGCLCSTYATNISQREMPLSLIQSLDESSLEVISKRRFFPQLRKN